MKDASSIAGGFVRQTSDRGRVFKRPRVLCLVPTLGAGRAGTVPLPSVYRTVGTRAVTPAPRTASKLLTGSVYPAGNALDEMPAMVRVLSYAYEAAPSTPIPNPW